MRLDIWGGCLHCVYMHRSCPPAKSSTSPVPSSVSNRSGSAAPTIRPAREGFTLIELLVVIAVIAILAGLTLSTLGYVNKKGAESRAQSEVAALSAAIESFKLDNGFYPTNTASLYTNLCPVAAGRKVYFEPTPSMVTNVATGPFLDPWGTAYGYSNLTSYFELWSTAGGTNTNNWIRN